MTLTLLVLAMVTAANPFRALSARPTGPTAPALLAAVGTTGLLVIGSAAISGPLLELVDVTGPNARIAAGIALLVVALKDVFAAPPGPEPALGGWRAGVVPLAFPVIFSPALALLAVAGASERGVPLAVAAAVIAVAPVVLVLLAAPRSTPLRPLVAAVGVAGTGVAALVVLDGVYAI